jgi:hypothetical protein
MNCEALFEYVSQIKYSHGVGVALQTAFKCEMYCSLVQKIEAGQLAHSALLQLAEFTAIAYLAGPGGASFTTEDARKIVASAVAGV